MDIKLHKKGSLKDFFFNIEKTEYIHYRIIPNYDISNQNNDSIAKAIANMYKTPWERISAKKIFKFIPLPPLTIKQKKQCHFNILLFPGAVEFYVSVPIEYEDLIVSKIKTIWNKAAINKVTIDKFRDFKYEAVEMGELLLRDYDFKSLNTDNKNLYPLTNLLGITKDLESKFNEKVRISFSIEPSKRSNWISKAKEEHENYLKGKKIDREKTLLGYTKDYGLMFLEFALNMYIEIKMLMLESIFGIFTSSEEKTEDRIDLKSEFIEAQKELNKANGLTTATTYKRTSEVCEVEINIMSQSNNKDRREINLLSVANSYTDISQDNELYLRRLSEREKKTTFNNMINIRVVSMKRKCYYSDKEVAKFIQMPQKTLQEEYKIDRIDTREVEVPGELLDGGIRIGIAEKQRKEFNVFHPKDKNSQGLAWIIASGQGGGKTTLCKNIAYDSYKAGNANIVIEYLQDCKICKDLESVIPKQDQVIIDAEDIENVPPLAYPEASKRITEDTPKWERLKVASLLAHQVEYLINTVSDDKTGDLTVRMSRFLYSACMAVFIHPNTTVKDVFDCLRGYKRRQQWTEKAKESGIFDRNDELFYDLQELDKKNDKGKIVGTRDDLISGILNRITALTKDITIKEMLRKEIDYTHDFIKYIDEGKTILIKIPEKDNLANPSVRDTIATYWMTRIWLCLQLREQGSHNRLCKILFDEVENTPILTDFISHHIHEFRRHQLGAIFTVHFMEQFKKLLHPIKNTGMSIQFLAGTTQDVFKIFEKEMQPFTIEDGLRLKQFQSLNIINYGNQYAKFISWLPPKPAWARD